MKKLKMVISLMFLLCMTGNTAVVIAQSGTLADLQKAINRASENDTVKVPSGDFTVKGTIFLKGGISLIGAGEGKTIFRHDPLFKDEFWIFRTDCRNGKFVRFSGFSIIGRSPELTPGILIENASGEFRVDHCGFERCSRRAIEIRGRSSGVIDHNWFIDNWTTAIVVYGEGQKAWQGPLKLGGADAVFVEDNFFGQKVVTDISMCHHIASNNGSRYVFRYNRIEDGKLASHAIDAHGNKFGWERGSRSYEIYNNKINAVHRWAGINIRGGDGVIFNNEFGGDFVSPVHLMYEGRQGDDKCNYPCLDQIRSLYIWGNKYKGKPVEIYVRQPLIISNDRDYVLSKMPGYTPYRYPHPLVK
jgi:hypothetical protein